MCSTNGCASAPRRPAPSGATGLFERFERDADGTPSCILRSAPATATRDEKRSARARVIGADGALSAVGAAVPARRRPAALCVCLSRDRSFAAAGRRISMARAATSIIAARCRRISTAGYFPHGDTVSVGTGSAQQGVFPARLGRRACATRAGLAGAETIRREGAPIPLHPLPRWDDGRSVLLAGDAAGVVAPASGEGIYYAMIGGRLAAEAVDESPRDRRRPRAAPGAQALHEDAWHACSGSWASCNGSGIRNDRRRERFVSICRDRDVQKLTWDAYMNKELVRAKPIAHAQIFFKNLAHLVGLASP